MKKHFPTSVFTKRDYPSNWREVRNTVVKECCSMCGETSGLHVHHIIPVSKGGQNCEANLLTLCTHCHGKKHVRKF